MDPTSPSHRPPSPPVHAGEPTVDNRISVSGLVALIAIGVILSVGLLFIPPLGLGVGLALTTFAVFTLITICASSNCSYSTRTILMRQYSTPVFGSWSTNRQVTVLDLGGGPAGFVSTLPPAGSAGRSMLQAPAGQRAPVGSRGYEGSFAASRGAPPPPGVGRQGPGTHLRIHAAPPPPG